MVAQHTAPASTSSAEELHRGLTHEAANVRRDALFEVAKFGEVGALHLGYEDEVLALLDDPEVSVREAALFAVGSMGKVGSVHAARIVAAASKGNDTTIRLAAIQAIGQLGPDNGGVAHAAELEACLDDVDPEVTAEACLSLGSIKAVSSTAKLAKRLDDSDALVIAAACTGLSNLDAQALAISKLLNHSDSHVRMSSARALASMSEGPKYTEQVARLVGDSDAYVRAAAVDTLSALGPQAVASSGNVVSALSALLAHKEVGVRAAAAAAIGGVHAGSAVSSMDAGLIKSLEALLEDNGEDDSTHGLVVAGIAPKMVASLRKPACAAACALGNCSVGGSAAKIVSTLSSSSDIEVRVSCLDGLSKLRSEGLQYVPQISVLVKDPSPDVSAAACYALGKLLSASPTTNGDEGQRPVGGNFATAFDAVADRLTDSLPLVRVSAAEALGLMVGTTPLTTSHELEGLVALLEDPIWSVRQAAVTALASCGESGQVFAAEVCRTAYDPHGLVRKASVETLSKMGTRGAAYIEDLEPLLQDPIPEVRAAIAKVFS